MAHIQRSYIYIIYAPDGRVYIGKTHDIKRRHGEYRRGAVQKQPALMESFVTYGYYAHSFQILFKGMTTSEKLNTLERMYIRQYDSENPLKGLNSTRTTKSKRFKQQQNKSK